MTTDRFLALYLVTETVAMKIAVIAGAVALVSCGRVIPGLTLLLWALTDIAIKAYAARRLTHPS